MKLGCVVALLLKECLGGKRFSDDQEKERERVRDGRKVVQGGGARVLRQKADATIARSVFDVNGGYVKIYALYDSF